MQTFGLVMLIISSSLSIELVALGLSELSRCIGVVPLETLPGGIGFSLVLLSMGRTNSAATLSGSDLAPFVIGFTVILFLLHPLYVVWRRRMGGESISLMISFAIMTCWIQCMSIRTESKSISPEFPNSLRAHQDLYIKIFVILTSIALLSLICHLIRLDGRLAALQLSMSDSRLLTTFGVSSLACQRIVLAISIFLITIGSLLYICLQQNFSFQNSYDIIVPAFAVSLSQTRIRPGSFALIAIFLLAGIECLTRFSAESTIREGHQAILFGGVVLFALIWRIAKFSGRSESIERRWGVWYRRVLGGNSG